MKTLKKAAGDVTKVKANAGEIKATKKQLQSDNRRRRTLTRARIARYGLRNFARNMWLTVAATVMMIIPLLIIFMTVVASLFFKEAIGVQMDKIDISIYFKSETSDDTLQNLAGRLQLVPNVTSVDTSNSDSEYRKMQDSLKNNQDYMKALNTAVENGADMQLPAVIHVKLQNPEDRAAVDKLVATDAQFKQWVDQAHMSSDTATSRENTVKRLSQIMNFVQQLGIGLAVVFVAVSILIIFNTIRIAIFSRREEINMMKAIGADQHFIRGPFLVEAKLYGVIAAVIATALGYAISIKALPVLNSYAETTGQTQVILAQWLWLIILVMVFLGMMIGDISARLAVRRYLKP